MSITHAGVGPAGKGMVARMKGKAEVFVHDAFVGTMVRIMILVGTPVGLAILYWLAGAFMEMRDQGRLESAGQARLTREVAELQQYRLDASLRGRAMQADVAAIRDLLTKFAADNQRQIDRLEQRIDQRQPRN